MSFVLLNAFSLTPRLILTACSLCTLNWSTNQLGLTTIPTDGFLVGIKGNLRVFAMPKTSQLYLNTADGVAIGWKIASGSTSNGQDKDNSQITNIYP